MRLFTALALGNDQKRTIFEWKERHFARMQKAISPENYHVTLAFFGAIKESSVEALIDRLDQANDRNSIRSFTLKFDQIAFWPKTGIVWVGPRAWPQNLEKLASSHTHAGASLGAKKSRHAYQPHISLARGITDFSGEIEHPKFELTLETITLFQSVQGSSGKMNYQPVYQWDLSPFGIHRAY